MIQARVHSPVGNPPRIDMRGDENAEPQAASEGSLWSYLDFDWIFTTQIPSLSFFSSTEDLRCSPRSYSKEMDELHIQNDLKVRNAYLKKALETIPLNDLQSSIYFWGHDNLDIVCKLLANNAPKFRQLIELTPPDKYNYYPGHCITTLQIEILLDDAFANVAKLQQLTDIILTMIGEPRNGEELDFLYYSYLKFLILRKKSDSYVADRIRACKTVLYPDQIKALKKIENAPLISKALQEIEQTSL